MDDIINIKVHINRHVGSFPLEHDQSLHYVIHGKKQITKKIMLIMGFTTDGISWYDTGTTQLTFIYMHTLKGFSRGASQSHFVHFWA